MSYAIADRRTPTVTYTLLDTRAADHGLLLVDEEFDFISNLFVTEHSFPSFDVQVSSDAASVSSFMSSRLLSELIQEDGRTLAVLGRFETQIVADFGGYVHQEELAFIGTFAVERGKGYYGLSREES